MLVGIGSYGLRCELEWGVPFARSNTRVNEGVGKPTRWMQHVARLGNSVILPRGKSGRLPQ